MARTKRTWQEKLADAKAKEDLPHTFHCDKTGKHFVVPNPAEVEAEMRAVRKGKVKTIKQICDKLAEAHGTEVCCPMTTGIFAWIISHAADEAEQAGRKRVVPWWRTVKTRGELNPKYPGGVDAQRARLEDEGHTIEQRGKKFFVAGA